MKQCNCNTPNLKPKCKEVGGITIVVIPAQLGDSSEGSLYAPQTCKYKNTIVKYLADGFVYAYDKDGNWTLIADSDAVEPTIDTALDVNSDNPVTNRAIARAVNELTTAIAAEAQTRADEDIAIRADLSEEIERETEDIREVQAELNRDFVNDLEMETSATNVTFKEDKVNPFTGVTSQEVDTIPSASATTAGTISASEYLSIKNSQHRLDALEGGSVAISGLSATPSQSDLTNAWLTETGESSLINRASIYDITNTKVWTYYDNTQTWYEVTAGTISVNPFTNSTAGTILGSTTDGNVSANVDGTGTVSGWSTLSNQVSTNTSNIALKANITDLPTIDSTLSDSSTNPVENQAIANEFEKVAYADGPAVSPSSTAFVDTQNIVNNAVTTAKIADGTISREKLTDLLDRTLNYNVGYGERIQNGDDLNNIKYLRIGKYYCSTAATATTLSNAPITKAFLLTVCNLTSTIIDDEATSTWVIRLQKVTTADGLEFTRYCHSESTAGVFIYGEWKQTLNSTMLSKLAYMPGDTITISNGTAFISTYNAGDDNKVSVRIPLNKSLDFVNGVKMRNGAANATYGFLINSSGQTTGISPRLAANQTVTGTIIPGFGAMGNFQAAVGASTLTAWSMGILMIGDFTITFS